MAIKRQVLRDEVEAMILSQLVEGRWSPGSRLSIDGLARDLEVSPTPVREAMVSLERSGFVEYVALRGYVVAPMLAREQIVELVDARKVIETAVLDRAFDDWEALLADLDRAHALHSEVITRIEAVDVPTKEMVREHFQADWEFHQTLFRHAGNSYLARLVDTLLPHTHRMRQTWAGAPIRLDAQEAYAEHGRVLDEVRSHEHDGALAALNAHLDAVLERSLASADEG